MWLLLWLVLSFSSPAICKKLSTACRHYHSFGWTFLGGPTLYVLKRLQMCLANLCISKLDLRYPGRMSGNGPLLADWNSTPITRMYDLLVTFLATNPSGLSRHIYMYAISSTVISSAFKISEFLFQNSEFKNFSSIISTLSLCICISGWKCVWRWFIEKQQETALRDIGSDFFIWLNLTFLGCSHPTKRTFINNRDMNKMWVMNVHKLWLLPNFHK